MNRFYLILLAASVGCGGPVFTNLGNGAAVPAESIEKYAEEHGVTRAAAREQIRAEVDELRVKEHAEKYGVSEEEARRQLKHAEEGNRGT